MGGGGTGGAGGASGGNSWGGGGWGGTMGTGSGYGGDLGGLGTAGTMSGGAGGAGMDGFGGGGLAGVRGSGWGGPGGSAGRQAGVLGQGSSFGSANMAPGYSHDPRTGAITYTGGAPGGAAKAPPGMVQTGVNVRSYQPGIGPVYTTSYVPDLSLKAPTTMPGSNIGFTPAAPTSNPPGSPTGPHPSIGYAGANRPYGGPAGTVQSQNRGNFASSRPSGAMSRGGSLSYGGPR